MCKVLIYIQLNTIHKTNFDKNSTVARTSGLDCTSSICVYLEVFGYVIIENLSLALISGTSISYIVR